MNMTRFAIILLLAAQYASAAFTEFYIQASGSNLNAGSTSSDSSSVTSTNGDWGNAAANTFTASSGTPFSAVTTNDYASIYLDGATQTAYVAKVTSVNGGGASITLSSTIKAGTAPTSGASGRSCKIGGAWAGPSGTVGFPYNFVAPSLAGTSTTPVRVNWKDGTYAVTSAITHTINGPLFFEGYSVTPGDNAARPVIQGPASGTAFVLFDAGNSSVENLSFENFVFENNGSTGTAGDHLVVVDTAAFMRSCIFRNARENGLKNNDEMLVYECEVYNTGTSVPSTSTAGFTVSWTGSLLVRCVARSNTVCGGRADGGILMYRSLYYGNLGPGVGSTGDENQFAFACDFYDNGSSGAHLGLGAETTMNTNYFNCNFVKNVRYGFESEGQATPGMFFANGFGSGTQANTLGFYDNDKWRYEKDTVTYVADSSPFVNAAAFNFNAGDQADDVGYASFLQVHPSYSGTTSFLDIGASHQ